MPITPVSLGTTTNTDRDTTTAILINCYAEAIGQEGKIPYPIYACCGFDAWSTLTSGGVTRGMLNLDDSTLYVVSGTNLYSVNTSGTATNLASISTSGYAYMARNRNATAPQVFLVTSDGQMRTIQSGTVSTPTLDSSIPAFNAVCAHDGYFVFTCPNGNWYISGLNAVTVDPLKFAIAQAVPDVTLRPITRGTDLIIAGSKHLEFWADSGSTDFPYTRTTVTHVGVYAAPSMANLIAVTPNGTNETVIFVGNNAQGALLGVMMLNGYQAVKISPYWLDRAIRDEPTQSSIRAFVHSEGGDTFYTLTASSFTAEYNATTGYWNKRQSQGTSVWKAVDATAFNKSMIFGDGSSGALYKANPYTLPANMSQIKLRSSRDSGNDWSAYRSKTIGDSTAPYERVRFNRLGQSKEDGFTFEVTLSSAYQEAGTDTDMIVIPPTVHAYPHYIIVDAIYIDSTPGIGETTKSKGITGLAVDSTTLGA